MVGQIFHQKNAGIVHDRRGFTIVELLIIVVILGTLSAIIIVSYNGVQSRAQDASVQQEMRTMAKLTSVYKVNGSRYPTSAQFQTLGIHANKQTYNTAAAGSAMYYCTNSIGTMFSIVAYVKSGSIFKFVSTTDQITTYTGSTTAPQLCVDSGVTGTIDYTPFTTAGAWNAWVLN